MYIFCMTRSEPWALALRAFCCIQIRTETFTSPAQRGKKLVFPSHVQPSLGFPLLFQSYAMEQLMLQMICRSWFAFTQEVENFSIMSGSVWCYKATFPSSCPVMQAESAHMGMPSLHVQWCELAEGLGGEGSCALFLTRTQHERTTCADRTISLGIWCTLATSHRELLTNKDLSF